MNKYIRIAVGVTLCLLVCYTSGTSIYESVEVWYPTLEKPFFTPSNWIFASVWVLLYVLMGIAAGLVWDKMDKNQEEVKIGMRFFAIQLGLGALWFYLFFELKNPFLALAEIGLLLLMVYETYLKFKKVLSLSGILLIPYLLWIGFVFVLNASVWWLNL